MSKKFYNLTNPDLGVGFGVDDFLDFENDEGELLQPLLVLKRGRIVDIVRQSIKKFSISREI